MNTVATKPLLERTPSDFIASRIERTNAGGQYRRTIRVSEFLGHVHALADALPDFSYAINLCGNRYRFLVAFAAIILRGQCNLLPANKNKATQSNLVQSYPECYVIHDGVEILSNLPAFDFSSTLENGANGFAIPQVPMDQWCAISFTSGSTGESKANIKTWQTLYHGMQVNAHYYFDDKHTAQSLLATVPAQHMYGLEASIMMPLCANVCVADSQPLFPDDIRKALATMPEPRVLVSTPAHIRALEDSQLNFPTVDLLLSATAPLDPALAERVESKFGGILREIYGCSEAGSIARRHITRSAEWEAFDVFRFRNAGSKTFLEADHLPEEIELQDVLKFFDDHHFRLLGRHEDMINIAGKRGSLAELNRLLLATPGVLDGVVFEPPIDDATGRLAALVVAPELSSREAMANLREHVDPAFIPRRVVFVDSLPRSESGKLPRDQVLHCYNKAIA